MVSPGAMSVFSGSRRMETYFSAAGDAATGGIIEKRAARKRPVERNFENIGGFHLLVTKVI
jgi:hypothetical protein